MNRDLVRSDRDWLRLKVRMQRAFRDANNEGSAPVPARPSGYPMLVLWEVTSSLELEEDHRALDIGVRIVPRILVEFVTPGEFEGDADQAVTNADARDVLTRAGDRARNTGRPAWISCDADGAGLLRFAMYEPEHELLDDIGTSPAFDAAGERSFLFGSTTAEQDADPYYVAPRMDHESAMMYEGRLQAARDATRSNRDGTGDCTCSQCVAYRDGLAAQEPNVQEEVTRATDAVERMRALRAAAVRACANPEPVWSVSSSEPVSYMPCGQCAGCRGEAPSIESAREDLPF